MDRNELREAALAKDRIEFYGLILDALNAPVTLKDLMRAPAPFGVYESGFDYMRTRETADFLGVTTHFLKHCVNHGTITCYIQPKTKYRVYRKDEIEAFKVNREKKRSLRASRSQNPLK